MRRVGFGTGGEGVHPDVAHEPGVVPSLDGELAPLAGHAERCGRGPGDEGLCPLEQVGNVPPLSDAVRGSSR